MAGGLLLVLLVGAGSAGAAEADRDSDRKALTLPGAEGSRTLELTAGAGSVFGKDELLLKDYVDIRYGEVRLQADTVRYVPATRDCFAEGNVILDSGTTRMTAEKVEYNLETETGVFYQARGYAEPSFFFEAAEVRKVDKDRYLLVDATFTTCTQPVPYWSLRVSRGTIHLNNYAYLHQVSFRADRVPIFYSPYLVWPIKEDRATGLLFPEFGYSGTRGFVMTNAFYWAMRRNMDATFFLDYYAQAGIGEGVQYRYVPSARGKGQFTGSFIRDQLTDSDRYFFNLKHRQEIGADFRLVADLNNLSDLNYYRDFQRDFRASTLPLVLSYIYLTRNWSNYSFNVRGERRDQEFDVVSTSLATGLTEFGKSEFTSQILPSLTWQGSKRRLGRSPLYFDFDTSIDSFSKETSLFSATYQRLDLFPRLSAPLRLAPWIDVNPSLGLRDTLYTQRLGALQSERDFNADNVLDLQDDLGVDGIPGTGDFGEGDQVLSTRQVIDDGTLVRKILIGSVEVIGPKFSRIYQTPDSDFSPAYKHTIEPRMLYLYQRVKNNTGIISFDEKDSAGSIQDALAYSLTTRLFAKRPGATPGREENLTAGSLFATGATRPPTEPPPPPSTPEGKEGLSLSPVEIASFSLSQTYSFLGPLSTRGTCTVVDGDFQGFDCVTSHFSPLDALFRFNPTLYTSLDLRANYDFLVNEVRNGSLSANYRDPQGAFVNLSWFFQNSRQEFTPDSSQLGLLAGTTFLDHRLSVGFQGHYDVEAGNLQDQRYILGYNTQCCGFTFELLDRNFSGFDQQEFRLLVNLKGIGNVLDLNSGSSAIPGVPVGF